MGIDCLKACTKEDSTSMASVPPGFASRKSFTLEKIDDHMPVDCSSPASVSLQDEMVNQMKSAGEQKFSKCLRQRPWINYSQFDNSSDEESEADLAEQGVPPVVCLPRGVVRDCSECKNCQKVMARWRPEEACRPVLSDAPVFHPTTEEFEDTLKYIASIQPKAELYGICRIVPPESWNPSCPLKEKHVWENLKFSTRTQRVDKLQNRSSSRKLSMYHSVTRRKRQRLMKMDAGLKNMDPHPIKHNGQAYHSNTERFGFEPGPNFTLQAFNKYADYFKEQYFRIKESDRDSSCSQSEPFSHWEPSVDDIEGEYWRVIEKPTEEIEVLYGADLDTGSFSSGFPKISSTSSSYCSEDKYLTSGWNLNNIPRLPGSLLALEGSDISGVIVPWLYIGMCLSSFCWHVEDHHFYSLNYMHWGAPKVWYGVPGWDALKLETTMKKHLADLFEEQPDLLHNLVTQFSPSILRSEGVSVFRCVQNPGEFVLTFPRAYHAGFNCGFNCAEAVNIAPIDWLPHGQFAVELYREQKRKISISHDKLLLGAAMEAVRAQWNISFLKRNTSDNLRWKAASGFNGILATALKARIDTEQKRREYLCSPSQSRKMDANFDANSERECDICHYDLHLSAVGCSCSGDRFACLEHAKNMCSCAWDMRFFLFRYDIDELNTLLDAVGGKLSAVHKWSHKYLGLSLSSIVNKEKMQESSTACKKVEDIKPKVQEPQNRDGSSGDTVTLVVSQDTKVSASPVPSGRQGIADSESEARVKVDQSVPTNIKRFSEGHGEEAECTLGKKEVDFTVRDPLNMTLEDQASQSTGGHMHVGKNCLSQTSHVSHNELTCSYQHQSTMERYAHLPDLVHESKHVSSSSDVNKVLSAESDNVLLNDNDGETPQVLHEIAEQMIESPKIFDRQMGFNNKVTTCNYVKGQVLETPEIDASVLNDADCNSEVLVNNITMVSAPCVGAKGPGTDEACGEHGSLLRNKSLTKTFTTASNIITSTHFLDPIQEFFAQDVQDKNRSKVGIISQPSKELGNVTVNGEKDANVVSDSAIRMSLRGQSTTANSSALPSVPDRYNRQGPRMARVVRRINSVVEPLAFGVVLSGNLWSCERAIFPKGFRSRVKYFSVRDPTTMCYYVSEVLDAGLSGPLFMVQVEQCPHEVFVHLSPARCWDLVRERVNNEIRKQHSSGRSGVPVLQPPGSLDGLEMFGLTSPAITTVIEAMDTHRASSEYWKSKRLKGDTCSLPGVSDSAPKADGQVRGPHENPGAGTTFQALLKKLNPEELHVLSNVLRDDKPILKEEAIKVVNEEMMSRLKS